MLFDVWMSVFTGSGKVCSDSALSLVGCVTALSASEKERGIIL